MMEPGAVSRSTDTAPPGVDTVRIEERGGAAVVAVRGHLDAGSAPLLRDALAWAVTCHERVVVDLSRGGSIDRAGLSVLIAAQDRAASRAVQLCFTAPSPQLLSALCEMRAGEMLAAVDATAPRPQLQPCDDAGFSLPRPSRRLCFSPRTAS
ncbi:STAS domain-containing protein [Actinoplanes missouriensis]|uniref:STAS domain-containing protein n=1 Tax=Actinoplanes missouriensis TaxID=1866 RepID=UPI0033DD19A0